MAGLSRARCVLFCVFCNLYFDQHRFYHPCRNKTVDYTSNPPQAATTNCVSYVSCLALSLSVLLLLLSTLLSHLGLTTAPHSTLVSLLCVWAASSGLSALPRAS